MNKRDNIDRWYAYADRAAHKAVLAILETNPVLPALAAEIAWTTVWEQAIVAARVEDPQS